MSRDIFTPTCLVTPVDNEGQLWYLKARERSRFFWGAQIDGFQNKPISNQLIKKTPWINYYQSSASCFWRGEWISEAFHIISPYIYIYITDHKVIVETQQKGWLQINPPIFKTGLTHIPPPIWTKVFNPV